jgi:thiamine kinase-like enzyme
LHVRILVEHHINGRKVRRANENWNIAWVCASCHDDVHAGNVIIEGWYSTSAGRELVWRRKGELPKLNDGAQPPLYSDD